VALPLFPLRGHRPASTDPAQSGHVGRELNHLVSIGVKIGLIGAGAMARGLALGWRQPVLVADVDFPRAQALAAEVGGRAVASNAEVAQRADLVVLCHKPAQLESVALEVAPDAQAVVSILAATPLRDVKAAYPDRPVYRVLPSTPVEVRQGAVILAADASQGQPILDARVQELFAELGTLVVLDDALIDVAMGLMSNAPAYYALVVEAQVDAGVRRGIPPRQASELVVQTMAGTAELIRRREFDTLAVRRGVTSPGGSTARGLDALERGGLRAAFSDAMDAILRAG
jgi:pyrroline-5-carboxylate reductase